MMEIQYEENNGEASLILPPKLALPQSVQLKDLLMNAMSQNHSVMLDFKNVQDVKTPFIQTLIAGLRYFKKNEKIMRFRNLVSSIEGTFLDLGLTNELNQVKGI